MGTEVYMKRLSGEVPHPLGTLCDCGPYCLTVRSVYLFVLGDRLYRKGMVLYWINHSY